MKFRIFAALFAVCSVLSGCKNNTEPKTLKFAVCADYPPFEYYENGKIVGFDIDLARALVEKLGQDAIFEDMQLTAMLASVDNGFSDAAISALAATKDRLQNYDFSARYYDESFATVYKKEHPIATQAQLSSAKIVCQLGSSMEIWLKNNVPNVSYGTTDNNNQAIEALKAGHYDCVFMDEIQATTFCKKNPGLEASHIATSGDGYSIALKKNSALMREINIALEKLQEDGTINKLQEKYLK
jgi:polar amino acid transport system substrate-binding protein